MSDGGYGGMMPRGLGSPNSGPLRWWYVLLALMLVLSIAAAVAVAIRRAQTPPPQAPPPATGAPVSAAGLQPLRGPGAMILG